MTRVAAEDLEPPSSNVTGVTAADAAPGAPKDEARACAGDSLGFNPASSSRDHEDSERRTASDSSGGDDGDSRPARAKSAGILRAKSLYKPDPETGLVPQKSGRRIIVVEPIASFRGKGRSGGGGGGSGGCCGCFG